MKKPWDDSPIAFPHAVGIADELAATITDRRLPELCFVGVMPGDSIAADYVLDCEGGLGYVRVQAIFPSTTRFPAPDSVPQRIVTPATTLEVGILRAAPVSDNGEAPSVEQQYDATQLQMADMWAILCAISTYTDSRQLPTVIGTYGPLGPQGGVVGGAWVVTIGVGDA